MKAYYVVIKTLKAGVRGCKIPFYETKDIKKV